VFSSLSLLAGLNISRSLPVLRARQWFRRTTRILPSQGSENSVLAYDINRVEQITGCVGFHHVTLGPSRQRFSHHLRRIVLGNKQNLSSRCSLPRQPAYFQAIQLRHGNIQDHYVWLQTFRFLKRFDPVRGLTHDLPTRAPEQHRSKALPYDWMIIDQ
jgi:hypothetical protein